MYINGCTFGLGIIKAPIKVIKNSNDFIFNICSKNPALNEEYILLFTLYFPEVSVLNAKYIKYRKPKIFKKFSI